MCTIDDVRHIDFYPAPSDSDEGFYYDVWTVDLDGIPLHRMWHLGAAHYRHWDDGTLTGAAKYAYIRAELAVRPPSRFECSACGHETNRWDDMKYHLQATCTHDDVRDDICQGCGLEIEPEDAEA